MATPTVHDTGAELEIDALRRRILRHVEPVLEAVGIDVHEVDCEVRGGLADLRVVLRGPIPIEAVKQAIGVRVIDAIRGSTRTLGTLHIDFEPAGG